MNHHTSDTRDPMLVHDAAILEAATKLRPLSHSTSALVELSSKPGVDMHEIGQIVTHDQVLATYNGSRVSAGCAREYVCHGRLWTKGASA